MTILAWVIGILAVGLIDGGMLLLLCKASRDEEWEDALRRAREAEEAGEKELEEEMGKILEELRK